ncbi:M15 family metallopeptidase [Candidatus Laterigemmans baculatus]|uniref:M15 family metallopeptidase n=1 Tax=Candidatus Laterigemmans baculatus TaxID=2770505 RepID=UPI00193C08BC|nr:M15 family metallopeptidase [Candidatus Laterigemmans baculatus]
MPHYRGCTVYFPALAIMVLAGFAGSPAAVQAAQVTQAAQVNQAGEAKQAGEARGTLDDPIIDSEMTEAEAFEGLDPRCPEAIRSRQALIEVLYYSGDGKIHQGQLVIDRDLVRDIQAAFAAAREEKFPFTSVIPISHPKFRKNGRWDDGLSMAANNTSAFNYREITGGKRLSNHAYGRAIDINPATNPYIRGTLVLPPGATYDPDAPGAVTADSAITMTLVELGWNWGGTWDDRKDYQHFEKPLER